MSTPKTRHQREHDLATLAAGGYTGWWDEHGQPTPFPDDFFDPHSDWRPDIQLVTHDHDEQPF
jgi:hypothetical protein